MRPYRFNVIRIACFAALAALGTGAGATGQELDTAGVDAMPELECIDPPLVAQAPTAPEAVSGIGRTVALDKLGTMRGGTEHDNDMDVTGTVGNNSADRVVTGNNTIDAGSFANSSGINTVVQNSGANVLIQNAMIVNVQFTPTP